MRNYPRVEFLDSKEDEGKVDKNNEMLHKFG